MNIDPILILNEKELTENVKLDLTLIDAIEKGFLALSEKKATVPPIMMLPVPALDGEVDIKSAFVHDMPSLAVKIASGFFKNPDLGLPSQSGQMIFDPNQNSRSWSNCCKVFCKERCRECWSNWLWRTSTLPDASFTISKRL